MEDMDVIIKKEIEKSEIALFALAISVIFLLMSVGVIPSPRWVMYFVDFIVFCCTVSPLSNSFKLFIMLQKRKRLSKSFVAENVADLCNFPMRSGTAGVINSISNVLDLSIMFIIFWFGRGTMYFLAWVICVQLVNNLIAKLLIFLLYRSVDMVNEKELFIFSELPNGTIREYEELKDSVYDGMNGLSYKKNIRKLVEEFYQKALDQNACRNMG